jgi:hypothetical protein
MSLTFGFLFPAGTLPLLSSFKNGSEAHQVSYLRVNRGSFARVKRPRRETDHSTPSSAEVKNVGAIILLVHAPIV